MNPKKVINQRKVPSGFPATHHAMATPTTLKMKVKRKSCSCLSRLSTFSLAFCEAASVGGLFRFGFWECQRERVASNGALPIEHMKEACPPNSHSQEPAVHPARITTRKG